MLFYILWHVDTPFPVVQTMLNQVKMRGQKQFCYKEAQNRGQIIGQVNSRKNYALHSSQV
jgi:hypothetical protein